MWTHNSAEFKLGWQIHLYDSFSGDPKCWMEAPVKGPMVLPWPAAAGGLLLKGGSGRPGFRWGPWVQVLAGGFDVTFPSRHLPAWDTSGAWGPQGTGGT